MNNFIENFFNVRVQKVIVNTLLVLAIITIELGVVVLIKEMKPEKFYVEETAVITRPGGTSANGEAIVQQVPRKPKVVNPEVFTFISVSLVVGWIGIMIAYFVWAIYFYNINLGFTNEEWEGIKKARERDKQLKALNPELSIETSYPEENPYKDETFGLPPGTVRGTIALSMLIGGFSLLILSQNENVFRNSEATEKYLEFFKTAFMMMIAFYFGSQSLKLLKTATSPTTAKDEPETAGPAEPSVKPGQAKTVPAPAATDTEIVERNKPAPVIKASLTEISAGPLPTAGPTKEIASAISRNESNKSLTEEEINTFAEQEKIEAALIHAVIKVESNGSGFAEDGRPKILFEGHIFWKQLREKGIDPEKYAAGHPDILYPQWTKKYYSARTSNEYLRLDKAMAIDADSALKSASWGMFQIMGFNYKSAGFSNVQEFVEAHKKSELDHLESFFRFISDKGLLDNLRNHDWRGFSKGYNGPGYEKNKYHLKLEEAYALYQKKLRPSIKTLLVRTSENAKETLGELSIINADREIFRCKTLELPWKLNKTSISCIPPGKYQVQKRFSEKHKEHFHVLDVPDRNFILIHAGNYYSDIQGCILVGLDHMDINKDGFKDITYSKDTLRKLYRILPERFELEIKMNGKG